MYFVNKTHCGDILEALESFTLHINPFVFILSAYYVSFVLVYGIVINGSIHCVCMVQYYVFLFSFFLFISYRAYTIIIYTVVCVLKSFAYQCQINAMSVALSPKSNDIGPRSNRTFDIGQNQKTRNTQWNISKYYLPYYLEIFIEMTVEVQEFSTKDCEIKWN